MRFVSDFIVKRDPNKSDARVFLLGKEIAEIIKEGRDFKLVRREDGLEWQLTNKVDGKRRPFSFSVHESKEARNGKSRGKEWSGDELFVVRDQLFKHNGNFYMLANHPEGKHWDEHVHSAVRYISRLADFPYLELSEIDYDHQTFRDKIKRFRGTPVGEASGLAIEEKGHRVSLDAELDGVGLFIAAISYLMYASA